MGINVSAISTGKYTDFFSTTRTFSRFFHHSSFNFQLFSLSLRENHLFLIAFSMKLKVGKWFLVVCLAVGCNCWAQTTDESVREGDWEQFVEHFMEVSGEETTDESWNHDLLEDLYEIYCEKINLNQLSREQLEKLQFLNEQQILEILTYVEKNRPVLSTGELMELSSLDYFTRRRLQLFCVAGPMPQQPLNLSEALKRSQNELVMRSDIPFYTKLGFAHYPAATLAKNPNKIYQGDPLAYSLRYKLKTLQHIEAGLQMEKDVGEKGIDYWAAYAMLKKIGCIERLVVGDYRLSFGLGLVVNTSTGFGKTMMMSSLGRLNQGIRVHSSLQESEYFRGIASTISLSSDIRLSGFASYRNIDGTFRSDYSGISSLKTDGLHRTQLERSKHGNLSRTDFGGNVEWHLGRFLLTATTAYSHYSTPLRPIHNTSSTRYRLYNADGTDFLTSGIGYSYVGNNLHICGETAMDGKGHLATLNSMQAKVGSNTLTLIQRYYQAKFVSILGKTFGENSRPQNESGLLVGWRQSLSRRLALDTYVDAVYFPWLKYQVSNSSWGVDFMAALTYSGSNGSQFSLRYRVKSKQKDFKFDENGIVTSTSNNAQTTRLLFNNVHSLRSQFSLPLSPTLSLKTTLAASMVASRANDTEYGISIGEQATWQNSRKLKFVLGATYFHTDSYNTRTYGYEPSLLYAFGMQTYSGEGCRLVFLTRIPILSRLILICKLSSTRYFDRSVIGTGLDQILHKHREDLQLQIQWKF